MILFFRGLTNSASHQYGVLVQVLVLAPEDANAYKLIGQRKQEPAQAKSNVNERLELNWQLPQCRNWIWPQKTPLCTSS